MSIPGFYFCVCPDPELSAGHVRSRLLPLAPDAEVRCFWADEGLSPAFWNALTLGSFMSSPKILAVRAAQLLPAADWKRLSAALATPHADVLPVFFLESPWEKGKPRLPVHIARLKCYAFASERKWLWMSPGLDRKTLRSFIQKEMQARGLRCDGAVLDYLAEIILPDASAVKSMLDQVAMASENGTVSREAVRHLASCTPEAVIFDVVRLIEQGSAAGAWRMLSSEGDGGEAMLFPLLGLLSRDARLLWQLRAGDKVYIPSFLEKEKKRLAVQLDFQGIAGLFELVRHAETVVKSGERQPLSALEELVINVSCLIGKASTGRAAL